MMWRALCISAPALVSAVLAGCQTPPPSFDFIGPYGAATQVPAPGTGSYGRTAPGVSQRPAANSYYSGPSASLSDTSAAGLASSSPSAVGDWRAATSASLVGSPATAGGSSQVIPASAITPIASQTASVDSGAKETVRIVEPAGATQDVASKSSISVTGGGMPVNDATRTREPRLFSPPPGIIAISQWPTASAAPPNYAVDPGNPARDLRGMSGSYPVAQVSAETPIPTTGTGAATETPSTSTAAATSTPAASTASSTSSSAPLGWKAKDGLK